ncbi:MAG: 50S ribosomal protein L7ae-like protein [Synergistales bacterium]|nr:50S ribosomal protein L7ae-like protein [Synergistales bacterium]
MRYFLTWHQVIGIIARCLCTGGLDMAVQELAEGKRFIGISQVRRELLKGNVGKLFVAEDADEAMTSDITSLAISQGIPVEMVGTMIELGRACAISRGAATAALQRKDRC